MKKPKKIRLIDRLLEMGACQTEKEAAARIMAGEVYINGQKAANGATVKEDQEVTLKGVCEVADQWLESYDLSGIC